MTKQVEIKNRDGHILRGIVNIPEDGTRFPAIVNVHGLKAVTKVFILTQPDSYLNMDLPVSVLIYTEMVKVMVNSRT